MELLLKNGRKVNINNVEDGIEVIKNELGNDFALLMKEYLVELETEMENWKTDARNYYNDLGIVPPEY